MFPNPIPNGCPLTGSCEMISGSDNDDDVLSADWPSIFFSDVEGEEGIGSTGSKDIFFDGMLF
jgi:hypothetical protein